ncbi:hypothetical protein K432DRAFT_430275 [Lepidopterella palustris CBS 459.81]|uniref:Uncharacterized protein n=1 Tax=Lepidopterella palustris CBS 459.81 TaxID=1314670 RepID=A0A8E2DYE7_9PEZI|nr:hypothetical protein K432DRAFT_430275 [Lepidopterella palustris CBS 459.81]
MLERHFTSLNAVEESGTVIRQRMMSSELDLNLFKRSTVKDHVSLIISRLYSNLTLRRKFNLKGSVKFENHGNTLSPNTSIEEDMQQVRLSRNRRRRSPRLLAQASGSAEPAAALAATRPLQAVFNPYILGGVHGSRGWPRSVPTNSLHLHHHHGYLLTVHSFWKLLS